MYGNSGKGHICYLSAFIFEQFIKLMSTKVQSVIVNKIVSAQYFSISFD